jgi:hypothetical protein
MAMKSLWLPIQPVFERVRRGRGLALRRAGPPGREGIESAAAAFGRSAAAPTLSGLFQEEKHS